MCFLRTVALFVGICGAAAQVQYGLLIDAGSSGSRLGMYKLEGGSITMIKPEAADEDFFATEPGLSSYADNTSFAGVSLQGIVAAATKYIPQELQASTKLWVKATAGMRTVDPVKIKATWASVSAYLTSPACPFKFISGQVISGEEESLFSYLTVNYLNGTVGAAPFETSGVFEMGGASMQVIFKPDSDVLDGKVNFYVPTSPTSDSLESVYATSYMYGINSATDRYRAALVKGAMFGATQIDDPCLLTGDSKQVTVDSIMRTFKGTGNFAECQKAALSLLNKDYECNLPPCPIRGRPVAPISEKQHFKGLAVFFYTANSLGLIGWNEEKTITPNEIKVATTAYCARDAASQKAAAGKKWKYAQEICFRGNLVGQLLEAFGFKGDSTQLTYARKYDWKLGSMLYDLDYMPSTRIVSNTAGTPGQPVDSSASSSADATSSGSSYSLSFQNGSGSLNASGSSGFYMMVWQWIILVALCFFCCAAIAVVMVSSKSKGVKKTKKTKKTTPAPAAAAPVAAREPEPEAVSVAAPLLPPLMPLASTSQVMPPYSVYPSQAATGNQVQYVSVPYGGAV